MNKILNDFFCNIYPVLYKKNKTNWFLFYNDNVFEKITSNKPIFLNDKFKYGFNICLN